MPATGPPRRTPLDHQPSPRKVEVLFKLVAPGSCGDRPTRRRAHHRESLLPVLCRPSHRNRDLRTTEATASRTSGLARRLPSRVPHNATDEGSKKNPHQSRLSALLLVFWLTSAIHRIFKERNQATSRFYVAASPRVHSSPPIPSAGASCLLASRPGRLDRDPNLGDAETIVSQE